MARFSAPLLAALLTLAPPASWLDQATPGAWNRPGVSVPDAPPPGAESATSERCRTVARAATLDGDRAVHAKGWTLFGPGQVFGGTEVLLATAGVDGMCRPVAFQGFVFSQGKLAGTISPQPMSSRTDGAALQVQLRSEDRLDVEFARYASDDPLCCPSRLTTVTFRVESTSDGPVLTAKEARTSQASIARRGVAP